MKAMLSQPMAGKTDEEIIATREKAISALKEKGYEIVNTLFTDEWYSKEDGGAWSCPDSPVLPRKVPGKHEPLSCGLLLQGLEKGPWVQD